MKGFLRRDFYLIKLNLKFYALFIAAFAILIVFTDAKSGFLSLYVVIFGVSSIMGLFSYDDFNHWTAYGATTPAGRLAMVDARYLLTLMLSAVMAALQVALSLLGQEGNILSMAAACAGVFLLYSAVAMPVCYHFGGTKARTAMVVVTGVIAGVIGMGGAVLNISGGFDSIASPGVFLLLPLVGAAALAVSWRVSAGILNGKEL